MKISATYRFISLLLSLTVLAGVLFPVGLHAMSKETCEQMQEMGIPMQPLSEHDEDCLMNGPSAEMPDQHQHSETIINHHHSLDHGFDCACAIDKTPVNTEAQTQLRVKVHVLHVVEILAETYPVHSEFNIYSIQKLNSFSPPPIFLMNESFLK